MSKNEFTQDTMVSNNCKKLGDVLYIDKLGRIIAHLPSSSLNVSGSGNEISLHFLNATFDVTSSMTAAQARILAYKLLIKAEGIIEPKTAKPILKGVRLLLAHYLLRGISEVES